MLLDLCMGPSINGHLAEGGDTGEVWLENKISGKKCVRIVPSELQIRSNKSSGISTKCLS